MHFLAQARKIKKNPLQHKFLYFQEMELSNPNISGNINPEKTSHFSWNGNPEKTFYVSESGNGTSLFFRKLLIFQEVTFRAWKVKRAHSYKVSYILGNEVFSAKPKKTSYIHWNALKALFQWIIFK